ncbi:hypothetical protein G6F68_018099 [Rhizopus microsporus]|nr:hypothetical protein G6F68_018099 [Rhizopus microsporus]
MPAAGRRCCRGLQSHHRHRHRHDGDDGAGRGCPGWQQVCCCPVPCRVPKRQDARVPVAPVAGRWQRGPAHLGPAPAPRAARRDRAEARSTSRPTPHRCRWRARPG